MPHEVAAALSDAKRPPVAVTIGGHEFRTRLAVYGGQPMVGVSKANRAAAGVAVGDAFDVDDGARHGTARGRGAARPGRGAGRRPRVRPRRSTACRSPTGASTCRWITEAKRPETRARRVAGTIERLREGKPLR